MNSETDLPSTPTPSPILLLAAKSSLEISRNEYLKTSSKLTLETSPIAIHQHGKPPHSKGSTSNSSAICLKKQASGQQHVRQSSVGSDPPITLHYGPAQPKTESKLLLLIKDSVIMSIANSERRSIHKSIHDYRADKPADHPHLSQEDQGVGQKKLLLVEDSLEVIRSLSKISSLSSTHDARKNSSVASAGPALHDGQRQHSTVMFDNVVHDIGGPVRELSTSTMLSTMLPLAANKSHVEKSKTKKSAKGPGSSKEKKKGMVIKVKSKRVVDPYPYEYNTAEKILAIVDVLKTDTDLLRLFTPCSQ